MALGIRLTAALSTVMCYGSLFSVVLTAESLACSLPSPTKWWWRGVGDRPEARKQVPSIWFYWNHTSPANHSEIKIMSENIQIMLRPEASRSYQTLLGAEVTLVRPMFTNCPWVTKWTPPSPMDFKCGDNVLRRHAFQCLVRSAQ